MEKIITKKLFAGILAVSAGCLLASCDPIEAVPANYTEPLIQTKTGEKVDFEDNILGTIYDLIESDELINDTDNFNYLLMNKKFIGLLLLCSMTLLSASAQSKHGWRGPENNGSYPDTGLLKEWPANGPEVIFETLDAGKGYSSPQVVGDRIYLTGMNEDENKEVFQCYDLQGKKLYSTEYGTPWKDSYPETRTTPTIEDGKAYVISGSGEVVCLDIADGKILWSVDGGTQYGRKTGNWGTSECPLVYDDKVIYSPCGDQTTMVALNKDTGEEVWKTRSFGDKSGYVTPILITYKGKRQIISMTEARAYGVNPDNGEIEWDFDDWGQGLG